MGRLLAAVLLAIICLDGMQAESDFKKSFGKLITEAKTTTDKLVTSDNLSYLLGVLFCLPVYLFVGHVGGFAVGVFKILFFDP